jgi:hypothetical protein
MIVFLDDILVPSFIAKQLYVTVSLSAVGMFVWFLPGG